MSILNIFKLKKSHEAWNIVESMSKAKSLYKSLIKEAHPDRHPNNKKRAEELTQLINKSKYNYEELLKLQKRIITELQ